ncbi:MAG: hypothetical protein IJQ63_04505, partial [Synergistaceae bacterium]|nr:hypothetical protein [Synergistaceae bacterium]
MTASRTPKASSRTQCCLYTKSLYTNEDGETSTNLVIHYEIMENGYRSLSYNALDNAWKTKGFFKAVENLAKGSDDIFPTEFRNLFGDYYVSCYQYGACYDAYISITTETSEQVKEVENKLTAELSLLTPAPTSKIRLKILCRKAKATVTIKIVT